MKKLLFYIFIVITCVSLTCCDDNQSLAQNMQNIGEKLDQTKDNAFYPLDEDKDDEQLVAEAKAAVEQLFTKDVRETIVAASSALKSGKPYDKVAVEKILKDFSDLAQKYGSNAKAWSAIRTYLKYQTIIDYDTPQAMKELANSFSGAEVAASAIKIVLDDLIQGLVPQFNKGKDLFQKFESDSIRVKKPTAKSSSRNYKNSVETLEIENKDMISFYSLKEAGFESKASESDSFEKIDDTQFKITINATPTDSSKVVFYAKYSLKSYKGPEGFDYDICWSDGTTGDVTIKWTINNPTNLPKKELSFSKFDIPEEGIHVLYKDTPFDLKSYLSGRITAIADDMSESPSIKITSELTPKSGSSNKYDSSSNLIYCGQYTLKITASANATASYSYKSVSKEVPVVVNTPLEDAINAIIDEDLKGILALFGSVYLQSTQSSAEDIYFQALLTETYGSQRVYLYPDILSVLYLNSVIDNLLDTVNLLSLGENVPDVSPLYNSCFKGIKTDSQITLQELNASVNEVVGKLKSSDFGTFVYPFNPEDLDCFNAGSSAETQELKEKILRVRNFFYCINNPETIVVDSGIFDTLNKVLSSLKTSAMFEDRIYRASDNGIRYDIDPNAGGIFTIATNFVDFLKNMDFSSGSCDWDSIMNIDTLIAKVLDSVKPALSEMQRLGLM